MAGRSLEIQKIWCQWEEQLHESSVCTQGFYLRQYSPAARKIKSRHKKSPTHFRLNRINVISGTAWPFWGQLETAQGDVVRVIYISASEKSLKGILYPWLEVTPVMESSADLSVSYRAEGQTQTWVFPGFFSVNLLWFEQLRKRRFPHLTPHSEGGRTPDFQSSIIVVLSGCSSVPARI